MGSAAFVSEFALDEIFTMSFRPAAVLFAAAVGPIFVASVGQADQPDPPDATPRGGRPNVVWIIADDLSPELGCYGYGSVQTPNVDRLAAEGTKFTLAFATAPVCSSSRTAFQTSQYQTTIGGHHHDTRIKPDLPEHVPTVTGLMRAAGYHVSNGRGDADQPNAIAKSHWNFVYDEKTFFDSRDWSDRQPGQPFFAQVQIREPHRPFVQRSREYPDAFIPPYYPDHSITHADWGNYLASIERMDQKVGRVLKRLDDEGLSENTLVMFFGDHGRPHVRDKQWLYDGGVHVPLLVRWPGRIASGQTDRRLVSLLDLMPTTLAAAGVPLASDTKLQGHSLLDPQWKGHERLFAARDRCGEAVDRIRSVRDRRFKYIRNFHVERPYLQHSSYKKLMYPVLTLMQVLHDAGQWDSRLMSDRRAPEELYDLRSDPHEMHNLASQTSSAETLRSMRNALDDWIVRSGDLGSVNEALTVDMEALTAEKWSWFSATMKKRGLTPETSDQRYLDWWREQLRPAEAAPE